MVCSVSAQCQSRSSLGIFLLVFLSVVAKNVVKQKFA